MLGAGLFGAALFFGDGIITPAISVLSAVEGLSVAAPAFEPFVVPIAVAVLVGLFTFQKHGTDKVGSWFGPIMLVWFATLAVLGAMQIVAHPGVLMAIDPRYAIGFFTHNGFAGFTALGGVVLAITGGEALYADMGHFGARPVRLSWLVFVLPALALNYMGQSALVLESPEAAHNPFYLLAPEWALLPLVGLATAATVIASQAVISGVFSLTRQAIQLGFCPRMEIRHTSRRQMGQIYLPDANERLLIGVIALVLFFRSSSGLANAYGIAVTGTMVMTSLLAFVVVHKRWGWSLPLSVAVIGFFLVIDLAFLGANVLKVFSGGWVPLVFAAGLCLMMLTWNRGRVALSKKMSEESMPTELFLQRLDRKQPTRVAGTAIFLTAQGDMLPIAFLHNLKHNKVLHERVIFLTVETVGIPRVPRKERVRIEALRPDFLRVTVDLRLHADAERAARPGPRRRPGPVLRDDGDLVLPRPRNPGAERQAAAVRLAGTAVHPDGQERHQRHRLLLHPHRPRRRTRRPGADLTRAGAASASLHKYVRGRCRHAHGLRASGSFLTAAALLPSAANVRAAHSVD